MSKVESITLPAKRIYKQSAAMLLQSLLPVLFLVGTLLVHIGLPNEQMVGSTGAYTVLLTAVLLVYSGWFVLSIQSSNIQKILLHQAPISALFIAIFLVWEVLTLKFNILPLPYFPSPVKILDAFVTEGAVIGISAAYSVRLLVIGFGIGALAGVATGILMGWYQRFEYWINPFFRLIGPIPSTAWIPIVLIVFPSSFTASIFLLALATWFPVTVMTWSGISGINKSFFEVARTLGANERYLIWKVAIPAALPHVFTGLFMGLGTSFVTLIVAEMLGVKAGLGWYIQWAQGWGEYYKLYAALFIMALLFSVIITVLFKVKDRVLIWQKGLMKW